MSTHKQWAVLALFVACLALASSPSAGGEKDKGKTITVTAKEEGTKVKLARGDLLQVRLEALPSAGYSWQVARLNEQQLKAEGKPEFEKPAKKVIGAKTTQVLRFRAEKAGTSDLELHYKRPFEKDKAPAKTFKLTVEVQ
jgi:inhibitor of cysteine peptidase